MRVRHSFSFAFAAAIGLAGAIGCSGTSGGEAVRADTSRATAGSELADRPAPPPCPAVDIDRELLISDTRVTTDPRTQNGGPWSFEFLVRSMAPAGMDPSDFVMRWLTQWETVESVNGFPLLDGSLIRQTVIDPWIARSLPTTSSDPVKPKLDLSKAPFKLLAIVDRVDLRESAYGGNAGEGRFVFSVLDANGFEMSFAVIFEYALPTSEGRNAQFWAEQWHALSATRDAAVFGPAYRTALEKITRAFSGPNADPTRPNGSTLNALRSNEFVLTTPRTWNIREFGISGRDGLLHFETVKQTPFDTFNSGKPGEQLKAWLIANRDAVLANQHQIPEPMLGSEAIETFQWNPGNLGATDEPLRAAFAINTCNGCHLSETGTGFFHVGPGVPSGSQWLRNVDLPRRQEDLSQLLCGGGLLDNPTTMSPRARPH
jgi:hypothetical protein